MTSHLDHLNYPTVAEVKGWGGNEAAIKANLPMAQPWVPTPDVAPGHIGGVGVRLLYKQTSPKAQPWVPTPGLVPPGHIDGVGVRLLYEQTFSWHSHGLPPQVFLHLAIYMVLVSLYIH